MIMKTDTGGLAHDSCCGDVLKDTVSASYIVKQSI